MSTMDTGPGLHVAPHAFSFRLPLLHLGRLRGSLVFELDGRERRRSRRARRVATAAATQRSLNHMEDHRTQTMAWRMGAGF